VVSQLSLLMGQECVQPLTKLLTCSSLIPVPLMARIADSCCCRQSYTYSGSSASLLGIVSIVPGISDCLTLTYEQRPRVGCIDVSVLCQPYMDIIKSYLVISSYSLSLLLTNRTLSSCSFPNRPS
jgi:hypothetical protein